MPEKQLYKRMKILIVVISAVIAAGGAIFYSVADVSPLAVGIAADGAVQYRSSGAFAFVIGVFMAAVVNFVKVLMIQGLVNRIGSMNEEESKNAANLTRLQGGLRLLLTLGVLLLAGFLPFVDILGAIFGVLVWNITAYIMKYSIGKGGKNEL